MECPLDKKMLFPKKCNVLQILKENKQEEENFMVIAHYLCLKFGKGKCPVKMDVERTFSGKGVVFEKIRQ